MEDVDIRAGRSEYSTTDLSREEKSVTLVESLPLRLHFFEALLYNSLWLLQKANLTAARFVSICAPSHGF